MAAQQDHTDKEKNLLECLKTHSLYSYCSFNMQLSTSMHSIMIGTTLREKSGIHSSVYIPREHYHVNGSYCTVKTLLLQMIAAGSQRGRDVS